MAKWTVNPGFMNSTIQGSIDYKHNESVNDTTWQVYQDERPYLDEVKRNVDAGTKKTHMNHKKFATIPDVVAIELLTKYNLDIHSPTFMSDTDGLKRLKKIIMTDYPHLVVNRA